MACLNCGHPFSGHEKFCPECGQKNKGQKITFGRFVKEVFNGFISIDAKIWTTLIPLLTKPGKVSKDFINGKRARYSNPFQFYISVSIIFFLILGMTNKYKEFQDFQNGEPLSSQNNILQINQGIGQGIEDAVKDATKSLDSVVQTKNIDSVVNLANLEKDLVGLDSVKKVKILSNIKKDKDSIKKEDLVVPKSISTLKRMLKYQKDYPDHGINQALDSLEMERTLWNRFKYTRVNRINSFRTNSTQENKKLEKELISYASIAIFIFLPIFTVFLRIMYVRRAFSYVEHLIFVFHTQTVFFLLSTLFFLLWIASLNKNVLVVFVLLFLLYLFLAMKRFYQQGFFKTLIKFLIVNFIFINMATIGLVIVSLIAFAVY